MNDKTRSHMDDLRNAVFAAQANESVGCLGIFVRITEHVLFEVASVEGVEWDHRRFGMLWVLRQLHAATVIPPHIETDFVSIMRVGNTMNHQCFLRVDEVVVDASFAAMRRIMMWYWVEYSAGPRESMAEISSELALIFGS